MPLTSRLGHSSPSWVQGVDNKTFVPGAVGGRVGPDNGPLSLQAQGRTRWATIRPGSRSRQLLPKPAHWLSDLRLLSHLLQPGQSPFSWKVDMELPHALPVLG